MTKTWLSAHLFYTEPRELLLINAVKPFVEQALNKGIAELFFYIRYYEQGPHIRLRLKGEDRVLQQTLKPELERFFYKYFNDVPSQRTDPQQSQEIFGSNKLFPNNSIQFIAYEQEVDRYGGPIGISIAEKQFQLSSQTVLNIIDESGFWNYDKAMGAALQLHLGFAFALQMSIIETQQFYSYISNWWISKERTSLNSNPKESEKYQCLIIKSFEDSFNKQREFLIPIMKKIWNAFENRIEFEHDWLNTWVKQTSDIGFDLRKVLKENKLTPIGQYQCNLLTELSKINHKLWPILGSYVHMTNNRLGILNRDEGFLSYLVKEGVTQF